MLIEPPADLSEMAQGRRVVQVLATLADDASIPSVRAYMVLSTLAELGETLACLPAPDDVESFDGPEVVAWLVSDRTDAELAEAAASVAEVADAQATEAVPDAARRRAGGAPSRGRGAAKPAAAAPRSANHGSSTVRVDAERLDQLMHAMGELVLNRTHVEVLAAHADVPGLPQAIQGLTRTSHALQAMVMQVRMIPVEAVLLRFPRLVRDLSVKLSKQVELELIGKDTELDRSVVDSLGDPLVHLIRNSLDHGLEGAGRARARPASPRPASCRSRPATPAATWSSPSRTTAAASTPSASPRRRVERGLIGAEPDRSTSRAPPSCSSTRASRPPTPRPTSPAAASAWTPCGSRSASSAARSR